MPQTKHTITTHGTAWKGNGETTEWEDILVGKGIIKARETQGESLEKRDEALREAEASRARDRVAKATVDDLDAELDDDFDDDRVLERLRAARIAEMKARRAAERFDGGVHEISRDEYENEVNRASKDAWVILHLYKDSIETSRLMGQVLARVAAKHKAVKFLKIVSTACIENWPDAHLPTLFCYHDGEMRKQLIGLAHSGGKGITPDLLEWTLSQHGVGALRTELEARPAKPGVQFEGSNTARLQGSSIGDRSGGSGEGTVRSAITRGGAALDALDDDDDW